MDNENKNPQFQFQSQGKLQEGSMIYLQMNRINQAFSKKAKSLEVNELKNHVFWLKQTIKTLEDNIDSFLDDEYRSERDNILDELDEADLRDKPDILHKYYKALVNLLHRQKLWFSTKEYYEVVPVKEEETEGED